jgi:hypothetical protein
MNRHEARPSKQAHEKDAQSERVHRQNLGILKRNGKVHRKGASEGTNSELPVAVLQGTIMKNDWSARPPTQSRQV